MKTIIVSTKKKKSVTDITDIINNNIEIEEGFCHITVLHTTASVTTADLDPGTDTDMIDAFTYMVPELDYYHPHDPRHVPDHIMSSIIGPSLTLPVKDGKLILGERQRVVLIDLDGPRNRKIILF